MAENNEFVPQLTLNPDAMGAAAAAAAPEPAAPAFTLEQDNAAIADSVASQKKSLSAEEQAMVDAFAKQIDITDTNTILTYGSASQKHISDFADSALSTVRTKDLGEVGDMLSDLVVELKGFNFDEKEKKGLFGLRKKAANKMEGLKADYAKAEVNVEKITEMLEKHQVTLMKDTAMLDKMYETNQGYFKELTMYILAGKQRLEECQTVTLPALQKKAQETGLPEDAQAASDYANMINRFEKKLYDLEVTRMVSVQMAPQIRLLQNNDTLLVEKIQTSIVNTIPLWKSQMVMALGLYNSQQAMQAQHEVTEMTNALLKKNAEMLKTGSVEIAKESERGVVDIETLTETNRMLIDTLEEVQQIQRDGSAKRHAAEAELGRIEGELKQKLLDLRR